MALGSHSASVKKSVLQTSFFALIVLVCLWLTVGRGLLGSSGILMMLLLFTLVPALIVYGIIVQAISAARHKKTQYTFSRGVIGVIYAMLASALVYGLTVIDGDDAEGSTGSVVTKVFGASHDSALAVGASYVATTSFYLFLVSLVVILFMVICEKRRP